MANNTNHDSQASTNYKEAFALFDKRGNQRVALESLGDLLRACGQNPTLAEIRELEKNVGSDCAYTPSAIAHLSGRMGKRAEAGSAQSDMITSADEMNSRLRDLLQDPQPPRRIPRPRRARGVLPRLPGL